MVYKSECMQDVSFYNEIKKCCLLKETNEISVYIGFADKEKYIIREAITKEAMFRMEAVIRLFNYILEKDPSFPCLCPHRVKNLASGKSVYVEKYIDGICLNNISQGKYSLERIGFSIVEYLSRLHSIKISEEVFFKHYKKSWKDNISKFIHERKEDLNNSSLSGVTEVLLFVNNLDKEASEFDYNDDLTIVHNDLNADNVLVLNDSSVFIIDYERWIIGDPLKDLSKMIWFLRDNIEFRHIFLNRYEEDIGKINYKHLIYYFKLDILNHISKFDKLINIPIWRHYYNQEFEIISLINKGGFTLW